MKKAMVAYISRTGKTEKMEMLNLGPLNLKEQVFDSHDGIRACQDYGEANGQMLG